MTLEKQIIPDSPDVEVAAKVPRRRFSADEKRQSAHDDRLLFVVRKLKKITISCAFQYTSLILLNFSWGAVSTRRLVDAGY